MTIDMAASKDQRFTFRTDWKGYSKTLDAVAASRVRVTYDRGVLELMTPGSEHEFAKSLIRTLVQCGLKHWRIPYECGGSITFRREDLDRGLEPDECFWIQSANRIRGVVKFDPTRDPPPDLVLEVDITRSSLDRLGIYAALGVPEVWRYHPRGFEILSLVDGQYLRVEASRACPRFPLTPLLRLVRSRGHRLTSEVEDDFTAYLKKSERQSGQESQRG